MAPCAYTPCLAVWRGVAQTQVGKGYVRGRYQNHGLDRGGSIADARRG